MRRRMIDPAFWTDSKVVSVSLEARLLFISLWNYADDEGYFLGDLPAIKRTLFPDQDFDIAARFSECRRFLTEYSYAPDECETPQTAYRITHFLRWQVINRPTPSKIKPFCTLTNKFSEDSLSTHSQVKIREVKIREVKLKKDIVLTHNASASPNPDQSLTADEIPEKKTARRPARARRPGDPRVKEFLAWYATAYQGARGVPYAITHGKDGEIVRGLLKTFDLDRLKTYAGQFLKSSDQWVIDKGFTIGIFLTQVNKIAGRAAGPARLAYTLQEIPE